MRRKRRIKKFEKKVREGLKRDYGKTSEYEGLVVRSMERENLFGRKINLILIRNIRKVGSKEVVADHVWIEVKNDEFNEVKFNEVYTFKGQVIEYLKGKINRNVNLSYINYTIGNIREVRLKEKAS